MQDEVAQTEWITIAEALRRIPVSCSRSTLRRWVELGTHGIVAGRFGNRLVVRADTLPRVEVGLDPGSD